MPNKKKKSLANALLIYPPIHDFALYDLFLKPYGLLNIASMLAEGGWNTRLINALDYTDPQSIGLYGPVKRKTNGTGKFHRSYLDLPDELAGIKRRFARYGIHPNVLSRKIAESRPDAIFVATGMTYWYRGVIEAVNLCRNIWPGVPVIMGGVYASLMPEHCSSCCKPDFIAKGSLLSSEGGGLSSAGAELNDFLFKLGLPGIIRTRSNTPLDDECWNDAAVLRLNDGCPMNCEYCASGILCGGFNMGKPESAFNMLSFLAKRRGTRNFAFYDDALLFNSEKVFKPFLKQVIEYSSQSNIQFNFYTPNAMHIRYMTSELAHLMKKAGFKEIRLGFESSSAEFHSEYDSKYSESSFDNSIKLLEDAGFKQNEIIVYILAGLPDQLADEVEDSIRFAAGKGLTLSVSEFSPVPGSPMWDKCVKRCKLPIEDEPLYHNNSFFPMQWEKFTRNDMQRLKLLSKQRL